MHITVEGNDPGDQRVFRVQFVHSAHDLKHRHIAVPGGLRQIVDNLAASLRRRVTLCEIATVEESTLTDEVAVDTIQRTYTPIAQGFALCHYVDTFVKAEGRAISLKRALKQTGLDEDTCVQIADACGFVYYNLLECQMHPMP